MNHVKSEHGTMGNTKIQLSYLLNPNFITLHVLCNIKTAMKNIPTNPFLITGYQGPDYFCDREKETASLMSALKNGRNITLISPRRMGKTGLIKNVFYYIQKENKSPVFIWIYFQPRIFRSLYLYWDEVCWENQIPYHRVP
jgi:hypothetical protein